MKNKQKGAIVATLVLIIAVLIIGGGLLVYSMNKKIATKADVASNPTEGLDSAGSPINIKGRQAYPIMIQGQNLKLYFFDDGSLVEVDSNASLTNYSGIGPTNLSGDEFYTAYPVGGRTEPSEVRVVNHATLEKKTIFSTGPNKVIMQVLWSANNGKIIWKIGDFIASSGNGDDDYKNLVYMAYDVKTQKTVTLPASITLFQPFQGDNLGIAVINNKFEVFNLDTLSIEPNKFDETFGFIPVHPATFYNSTGMNFSENGQKVVYSHFEYGPNRASENSMNNIFADLSVKTSQRITPLTEFVSTSNISPDGGFVAYTSRRDKNIVNSKDDTYLYSTTLKTKTLASDGYPVRWLDNNRLIIFKVEPQNGSSHHVYDVSAKTLTRMQGVNNAY